MKRVSWAFAFMFACALVVAPQTAIAAQAVEAEAGGQSILAGEKLDSVADGEGSPVEFGCAAGSAQRDEIEQASLEYAEETTSIEDAASATDAASAADEAFATDATLPENDTDAAPEAVEEPLEQTHVDSDDAEDVRGTFTMDDAGLSAVTTDAAGNGAATTEVPADQDDSESAQEPDNDSKPEPDPKPAVTARYRASTGKSGWSAWAAEGETAGSISKVNTIDAIRIELKGDVPGSVQYQLYRNGKGWSRVKADGAAAGQGESGTVGAIRAALTGKLSKGYKVRYRVYVPGTGWLAWKEDGETAGSTAKKVSISAFQVALKKRAKVSKSTGKGLVGVSYDARKPGKPKSSWAGAHADGATIGSTGSKAGSTTFNAIRISVDSGAFEGGVSYQVHLLGKGWSGAWVSDGAVAGASSRTSAIDAMKVKLTGAFANNYDIVYRAYREGAGWSDWEFDGRATADGSRVSALWVKLVEKGTAKTVASGVYRIETASKPRVVLANPSGSAKKGTQMASRKVAAKAQAQKFYVRNEGDGLVSLQSVASGLFLGVKNGQVVQLSDKNAPNLRWKTMLDGGLLFVNQSTGQVLTLAGGKAKPGIGAVTATDGAHAGQRWAVRTVRLVEDGYYEVKSKLGTYLDVAGGSYSYDANIATWSHASGGAQVFHVYRRNGGAYTLENARSYLAVGVARGSKANGANVVQRAVDDSASKQWKIDMDRTGGFIFTNKHSGKVLEIAGSSANRGANVCQGAAGDARGQRWKLVPTKRYTLSGNSELDRNVVNVLRSHTTLSSVYWWTIGHAYRNGERYWSGPRVLPDSRTIDLANDFFWHGSGNCYRFAATFSWLARGLGYSTNVISGWVGAAGGGQAPHGWVEVYSGGTRICDPDLQKELPGYNWYMTTYATSPTAYYSW